MLQKHSTQGFTLIELVIVIIVLGVLSAVAIPKFVNKSGFEDHVLKDQLIARLRLTQLQNMNADPTGADTTNACYWLVVKSNCFYSDHTTSCSSAPSGNRCSTDSYSIYDPISFSDNMLSAGNYIFQPIDGKLIDLSTGKPIITSTVIGISGDNNLSVTINSEGYIHE